MKYLLMVLVMMPIFLYAQEGFVIRTNLLPDSAVRYTYAYQSEINKIYAVKSFIRIYEDGQRLLNPVFVIIDTLGNELKRVEVMGDSLNYLQTSAIKYKDHFIVSGIGFVDTTNYFFNRTFDGELNVVSTNMHKIARRYSISNNDCYDFLFFRPEGHRLLIAASLECYPRISVITSLNEIGKEQFYRNYQDSLFVNSTSIRHFFNSIHKGNYMAGNELFEWVELDSTFNVIKRFENYNDTITDGYGATIIPEDNHYLYIGMIYSLPIIEYGSSRFVKIQLDSNFSICNVPENIILNFDSTELANELSIQFGSLLNLTGDKGYYCIGYISNYISSPNKVFIIRFDRDFRLMWTKTFIGDRVAILPYSVTLTYDEHILLAGDIITFPRSQEYFYPSEGMIMRLGPDGSYPLSDKKHSGLPRGIISIVNNPVHDYLTLEQSETTRDYRVSILNLTGKVLIAKQPFNAPQLQIPVGRFPPGVYMYVITEGSRQVDSGKFVKQ